MSVNAPGEMPHSANPGLTWQDVLDNGTALVSGTIENVLLSQVGEARTLTVELGAAGANILSITLDFAEAIAAGDSAVKATVRAGGD